MDTTLFLSRVIGPVLIVRGFSILWDREHFSNMLENLDKETGTVGFAMVPIAIMMSALAILQLHHDTSSPAAILFHVIAWGAVAKTSALIMFPRLVIAKAQMLGRIGFLTVVCVATGSVNLYLSWFGYLA